MWLCTEWKIDWDAVAAVATAAAAIIALIIWSFDKAQRKRERAASAKLLAQIMTTPVGATQIEIAKFRCYVVSSDSDQTYLLDVLNNENARKDLAAQASKITIDLPSQFLDKADIFNETVNNRLANAFSQVNRLKKMSSLLGDLPNSAIEKKFPSTSWQSSTKSKRRNKQLRKPFRPFKSWKIILINVYPTPHK